MKKKAIVFDIVRSSFVDGDGIRTTVFFKGCNMRCKWCHNPEGLDKRPQMLFYKNRCKACGKCNSVCGSKENCTLCGKCALLCPNDAREICGKEYTKEELFAEIVKDKSYYEASGGGVTLSGGECMLNTDFLCELLPLCKKEGINIAIDTAGNVDFREFEKILPYVDTFLYDIKCVTSSLHKEFTGVTNEKIIENLKRLKQRGADLIIRVPVIGGFNDTDEEMGKIAALVREINPRKCELLPYHNLGEHKYEVTGVPYMIFETPDEKRIAHLKELLNKTNI